MTNGSIVYKEGVASNKISYNILRVPRGSQIASIVLSDGSKVFLNSASSLKYPVSFVGNERKVEITGEAYFEIAKDSKKKFIVQSKELTTEVLGTHFNVNTYEDEQDMKVTLLEGSVKVSGGSSHIIIKPGDQAEWKNGVMKVNKAVNIDQVMAWKNGRFQFESSDIESIMLQLSRIYDIQVKYEGGSIKEKFGGGINRNANISQVLKILELTGKVHFRIENRIVYVRP